MSRSNRLFLAGLGLVLAVVAVAGWQLFTPASTAPAAAPAREPAAAAPPPKVAEREAAQFASATGSVEVRLRGGEWRPVAAGAALTPGSDVRTGQGGKAALLYGDDVRIELSGESEVKLAELNEKFARFVVGEGLVFADVLKAGQRAVQFTSRDGQATAETKDGALFVAADANGQLRAAVTRGEATLASAGSAVTLKAGFVSVAGKGRPPSSPAALPRTLLVKIRWPAEGSTAKRRHLVTGTTSPGARVRLGETHLWADNEGRFSTVVDLREGSNRLRVQVVDVIGRTVEDSSAAINLDTHAPPQAIETSPDMWKQKQ